MPEVSESWPERMIHAARKVFSARARGSTALEYELRRRADELAADLAKRDGRIFDLEFEVADLKSSLRIANGEVVKLTEVCERDRRRVEADTAIFARKIADSTSPH